MSAKQLAVAAAVLSVAVAVLGASTSSSGDSQQQGPGIAYGGWRSTFTGWLRLLRDDRNVIVALEIGYPVPPRRCSDKKGYWDRMYAGGWYDEPIRVQASRTFSRTVMDRYTEGRSRIDKREVVTGTVTDEQASGTIEGRVTIVRPNGLVKRCTFGPQRRTVFN